MSISIYINVYMKFEKHVYEASQNFSTKKSRFRPVRSKMLAVFWAKSDSVFRKKLALFLIES